MDRACHEKNSTKVHAGCKDRPLDIVVVIGPEHREADCKP